MSFPGASPTLTENSDADRQLDPGAVAVDAHGGRREPVTAPDPVGRPPTRPLDQLLRGAGSQPMSMVASGVKQPTISSHQPVGALTLAEHELLHGARARRRCGIADRRLTGTGSSDESPDEFREAVRPGEATGGRLLRRDARVLHRLLEELHVERLDL